MELLSKTIIASDQVSTEEGQVPKLVFGTNERGPRYQSPRLDFAALVQLEPDEHTSIRALIEGALLRR